MWNGVIDLAHVSKCTLSIFKFHCPSFCPPLLILSDRSDDRFSRKLGNIMREMAASNAARHSSFIFRICSRLVFSYGIISTDLAWMLDNKVLRVREAWSVMGLRTTVASGPMIECMPASGAERPVRGLGCPSEGVRDRERVEIRTHICSWISSTEIGIGLSVDS